MNDIERALLHLADAVAQAVMRIAELERRMDSTIRHGKVTDVDTTKQLARIEIGEKDGKKVKSAWVPYAQFAGPDAQQQGGGGAAGLQQDEVEEGFKYHNPPVKGQQMTLFAPTGEIRQGVLLPFTWWTKAKSPSDKPDEHVEAYGKLRIIKQKDFLSIAIGGAMIEITESKISIYAPNVSIAKATYTGQDEKGGTAGPKVMTETGPAKQHWSVA